MDEKQFKVIKAEVVAILTQTFRLNGALLMRVSSVSLVILVRWRVGHGFKNLVILLADVCSKYSMCWCEKNLSEWAWNPIFVWFYEFIEWKLYELSSQSLWVSAVLRKTFFFLVAEKQLSPFLLSLQASFQALGI